MKTNATKLKWRIFGFLMFLLPAAALAQTPSAYVCGTGTVKLTPNFSTMGYTPVTNDKIIWTIDGNVQPAIVYNGSNATYETSSSLTDGNHTYVVTIEPNDPKLCPSSPSDVINIFKLPPPAIAVSAPGSVYCTDQTETLVITASNTNTTLPLPTGLSLRYVWSASKNTIALTPTELANLGDVSATTETFTTKVKIAAGDYNFTAVASYTAGTTTIVPAATCTGTAATTIKVTVKPGQATITVTP
ncbi:hypothetical protein [Pedobacter frigidisoli]|uniref:hypothetical protein n=1 Tax=Pedobacter frigidisoli TaxID=2530455 RepID=UPI0029307577|nr:hypothetical protein [Pedobacter frigidisoli]